VHFFFVKRPSDEKLRSEAELGIGFATRRIRFLFPPDLLGI